MSNVINVKLTIHFLLLFYYSTESIHKVIKYFGVFYYNQLLKMCVTCWYAIKLQNKQTFVYIVYGVVYLLHTTICAIVILNDKKQ